MLELDPAIGETLQDALAGKDIGKSQAMGLMTAVDNELHALCQVANELRERSIGDVVTYVSNRNVFSTNICRASCRFCGFKSADGIVTSKDDILSKCSTPGITEICMQGGLHPKLGIDYYEDILLSIKDKYPNIHIHAFSPAEVNNIAIVSDIGVLDVLERLKDAGLGSMPGTAAEILDDDVRSVICPDKIDTRMWVDTIKAAHRTGIPTTSTIMYGHIETAENRVDHILLLKDIQRETKGFTEFVPLSFMPENELGRQYAAYGATGVDDIRMIAVSRILLNDSIPNIQTSWVKLGKKLAQHMLVCGANDLGGTLYEENISKASGGRHGEHISKEELARMVSPLGRKLRQRDTLYNYLD